MQTIRTFIALEFDPSIKEAIGSIQDQLKKTGADVKWVKPKNIHLTLKFLGHISPKKLKSVLEIFPTLFNNFPAFEIDISHLGVFPRLEQPKVIWVGIGLNKEYGQFR